MNIVQFVGEQENLFTGALTVEGGDQPVWHKESQFAIQAFQGNDFLAKTAMSNPTSAQNAITNLASIGISLNPALKYAYLVPRKKAVCLDISYMGLLHLACMSGSILWGQAKVVYENDTYINNGLSKEPAHQYNPFGDRGQAIGVYCTVKTALGDYLTDEMSKAEVLAIKARSPSAAGHSPWKTDELEMWRKTVVKRAYKYWPKCERLAVAIQVLNEGGEGIDFNAEKDAAPVDSGLMCSAEQQEQLIKLATDKGRTVDQLLKWLSNKAKICISELTMLTDQQAEQAIKALRAAK